MDLFHAVTQGLESVLTCDWYDSFKSFNPSSSSNSNSNSTSNSTSASRSHSPTRRLSESITTTATGTGKRDSFGSESSNMASGSDQKMMDTVPGGENTQYESIKTVTNPTEKERGQLGSGPNTSEASSVSDERGQQTTESIRYGQNISESGVGGKTTTSTGSVGQQGGYGGKPDDAEPQKNTRREQGYGPSSGVGA